MPDALTRRRFLHTAATAVLTATCLPAAASKRKFTLDLVCGTIGVKADLPDAMALAHKDGFESVAPDAGYLGKLSDAQLQDLLGDLKKKNLVWGAAGLPVDFRTDVSRFDEGMKALPATAAVLQHAGVTRVGTWLRPSSDTLTYLANFKQHGQRLRQVAQVLGDHGLRFGLEYVSPKTSWTAAQHSFIHSLAETKELIAEIGRPNVGLVLDSWHWYNAGETAGDLLTLTNKDVVACDLNDAPAGIPREKQLDNTRELPAATGVIDLKAFLGVLVQIGYDGPVRAEPFNAALRKLPRDEAVAETAKAMKKAFALIE